MDQSFAEKCNPNLGYLSTLPLEIQVREFLKIEIDNPCCSEDAVCGEPYKHDIFFNEDGKIEASRSLKMAHVVIIYPDQNTDINLLTKMM